MYKLCCHDSSYATLTQYHDDTPGSKGCHLEAVTANDGRAVWDFSQSGLRLRREGWVCTRIICSPYRSCLETAARLVEAITTTDVDMLGGGTRPLEPLGKIQGHGTRSKVTRRIVNAVAVSAPTPPASLIDHQKKRLESDSVDLI